MDLRTIMRSETVYWMIGIDAVISLAFLPGRLLRARETTLNLMMYAADRFFTYLWWFPLLAFGLGVAHALTPLRLDGHSIWTWLLALVLSDLSFYAYHRSAHALRALWTIHSVHHSSPDMNVSTAVRLCFLEGLVRWPFWIGLSLVGIPVVVSLTMYNFVRFYQIMLHSHYVPRLSWFERIGLMTPSLHRVHHGYNDQYTDKNFGGITYLWDMLFGTFARETVRVDYGIAGRRPTWNPLSVALGELGLMLRDAVRVRSLPQLGQVLFGSPREPAGAPSPTAAGAKAPGLEVGEAT